MRLHDVIVNEPPKFQCLEPTNLPHTIILRGNTIGYVLAIPLDLHGVVSCFETFKPAEEEFYACGRCEFTYESPKYDPFVNSFSKQ
jgi:hypothetical protein